MLHVEHWREVRGYGYRSTRRVLGGSTFGTLLRAAPGMVTFAFGFSACFAACGIWRRCAGRPEPSGASDFRSSIPAWRL